MQIVGLVLNQIKIHTMKKSILNLGRVLNNLEQKELHGGSIKGCKVLPVCEGSNYIIRDCICYYQPH